MVNWEIIREEFPVCKRMVYLNPAGGSPMSKSAAAEGTRFYSEMLEYGDTYWDNWLVRTEEVRGKLAEFINAEKEEIAFTTNTSHGMNLIAHILREEGDVLTMHDEFPSSTFPWLNIGKKPVFVEPVNGVYSLQAIEKALTPEIKILVASYVQYRTGFRVDLKELGEFCRKNELIFVLNATQALGIFPVDVKEHNIDFLVFTGLKWLTAGYGSGGLYVNKKWVGKSLPFAGWRSAENPGLMNNQLMNLKKSASVMEAGCSHFPCIFALGGALDLFNSIGQTEISSRILYLSGFLTQELQKSGLPYPVASPLHEQYRSGITILKMESPQPVVAELRKRNIFVSARGEGIRISVSIFNNEDDIIQLISALKEITK